MHTGTVPGGLLGALMLVSLSEFGTLSVAPRLGGSGAERVRGMVEPNWRYVAESAR